MLKTLLLSLSIGSALFASPILVLDPNSGAIAGRPGDTIGWGFTLTNDSLVDTLMVTSSYLTNESNPLLGTYSDIISYAGGLSGGLTPPNTPWTESFQFDPDPALQTGVGFFLINSAASTGSDSATLVVEYELDDASTGLFYASGQLTAPVSVQVVSPEPGTLFLILGAAVLQLALIGRARREEYAGTGERSTRRCATED